MNIETVGLFKGLENRLVVCSDVLFEIEGKYKKARFFITEPQLSLLLTTNTLTQIYESIRNIVEKNLNPKWEFEDIFYFTFTGSHFQQEDEKPEWSEDGYRS